MTCDRCGQQTPRARLCKECARLDRVAEAEAVSMTIDAPACARCDGNADDGDYSERDPGVWLCDDCLGGGQTAMCDGGQR